MFYNVSGINAVAELELKLIKKPKIMNGLEKIYLDRALFYKELYKNTSWWKFKKRKMIKKSWDEALSLMIEYGS